MGWPWRIYTVDDEAKHLRRQTLDRYAGYAQLSAFAPIVLFLLFRLSFWILKKFEARRGSYNAVPASPSRKLHRQSPLGAWEARFRRLQWWLEDDVVCLGQTWGRKDEWVFGLSWASWMTLLSVLETGDDYFHVTKRFGIIAISQLPLQYILALKSLNPVAYIFQSSHEQINRYHRVLGVIVYGLLLVHAGLYSNYFVKMGLLLQKLTTSRAVITGMVGIWAFTFLSGTALRVIRDYSYRIFFITHLTVAMIIPPLIWFHAHSSRIFLAEALLVFLVDIISRKLDTVTSMATLESISGTNLVKITTSIPVKKANRFRSHPGSHIYLQIPAGSRPSTSPVSTDYLVHEFLFNPFTVAAVDEETGAITLVCRQYGGPMTSTLKHLANKMARQDAAQVPLAIEGPYGVPSYFPKLSGGEFDRILLVAGGVGATFTVPLYHALVKDNPSTKVQLVWAVRSTGDVGWVLAGKDGKAFAGNENVQVFVTGSADTEGGQGADGEGVELTVMNGDHEFKHQLMRPNLRKIVDDVFHHGSDERVAVLFCGPTKMGRDLRNHVGAWVKKGKVVFWHSETFGW
ncbi:Ferric/cupric reductase transmembrane component 2 [Cytospora mali]|uniref:Ferric/cupric reductase transmembrane component 2 n=1 Tax=Cytospora mali TaxID=578113 RepID=A0A194W5Z2_CYTMA|nr:Ferric/cupric reductase transmembrane component 2 [Valsa mali]